MSTLLLYETKTGATETYARKLAELLPECTVVAIKESIPNVSEYDKVILGAGVRMGGVYRKSRAFMKKDLQALQTKPLWIFLVGIDTEGFAAAVDKNIPEELRKSARGIVHLKGKQPFEKNEAPESWFDEGALEQLAESITTLV